MPVKVKCKGCSAVLNAPDRARGKAIKCPKCGKPVRVPSSSAARAKSGSRPKQRVAPKVSSDDDDFLAGMDLGYVEDRSKRVCPRCGATAGDEDIDCPSCGADLQTGGKGKIQRARAKRKGAAPSEFYSAAIGDSASYFAKKLGLLAKSILMFTIFPILTYLCIVCVIWCHNPPPEMFWMFVGTICFLITPGWIWHVQHEFILRIIEPKRDRYPLRFEPFTAVALGVKSVAWSLFFGLPIWILFGGGAGLFWLLDSVLAAKIVLGLGFALFAAISLISWPIVQAHFAMPITWPGWMIHKTLADVAPNIGTSLFAAVLAFGMFLPVAGLATGAVLLTYGKHEKLEGQLLANADINAAKEAVEVAKSFQKQPTPEITARASKEAPEIEWMLMLWPIVAIIPVGFAMAIWMFFFSRITALFVKLFRPNISNLITHEKDYVYTPLSPLEQEELERERGPLTAASVKSSALLGIVFSVLGGLALAFTIGEELFGYLGSFAIAIGAIGGLINTAAFLLIVTKAFRTSFGWGMAVIIPPINTVGFFLFIFKEAKQTIYDFQLYLISVGFFILAGVLLGIQIAMAAGEAASKEGGEKAEQALRLLESAVSFLC